MNYETGTNKCNLESGIKLYFLLIKVCQMITNLKQWQNLALNILHNGFGMSPRDLPVSRICTTPAIVSNYEKVGRIVYANLKR